MRPTGCLPWLPIFWGANKAKQRSMKEPAAASPLSSPCISVEQQSIPTKVPLLLVLDPCPGLSVAANAQARAPCVRFPRTRARFECLPPAATA